MISNVSDYLFVTGANIDAGHPHGDMDRIIIDGGVMPLRTGVSPTTGVANAKILRGEDPCFLMEAWEERMNIIGNESVPRVKRSFDRRLGVSMNALLSDMNTWLGYNYFVDELAPNSAYNVGSDYWTTWLSSHKYSPSDIGIPTDAFSSGKPLNQQYVLGVFNAIKKFNIINQYMTPSIVSGGDYEEIHSLDTDYPFTLPSNFYGYYASGGTGISTEHPNAFGGWGLRLPSRQFVAKGVYNTSVNLLVAPNITWFYIFEHLYYNDHTSALTDHRYQLERHVYSTSSGPMSFTDSALQAKYRFLDAMSRYWGLTPSYVATPGEYKRVYLNMGNYEGRAFTIVGDHTKWW